MDSSSPKESKEVYLTSVVCLVQKLLQFLLENKPRADFTAGLRELQLCKNGSCHIIISLGFII